MKPLYYHLEVPQHQRNVPLPESHCDFLYDFVKQKAPKRSLEVGFAYGFSAAYIMAARGEMESAHVVIDPWQFVVYQGLGFKNVRKVTDRPPVCIEKHSHIALAQFDAVPEVKIDFALIDGDHRFDYTLVDFFLVDKLLNVGGYVLLHDTWMPAVQKVSEYILANMEHYQEEAIPVSGMKLFRKINTDTREWDHFQKF